MENRPLDMKSGLGKDSRRPGKGNGVSCPLPERTGTYWPFAKRRRLESGLKGDSSSS